MDFKTNGKLISAIWSTWGQADLDNFFIEDIEHAWVVSVRSDELVVGGLRLIVPKNQDDHYLIPSSYIADSVRGITGYYTIELNKDFNDLKNLSLILAKHINLKEFQIYKMLSSEKKIQNIFISSPKLLETDIQKYGDEIQIYRTSHSADSN